MQTLLTKHVEAFTEADALEGNPKARQIKILLQQAVAHLDTDQALALRGRLAAAGRELTSAALVLTDTTKSRFNKVAPPQPVFVDPNRLATEGKDNAQPVAPTTIEKPAEDPGVDALYARILKMSPNAIVNVYGESSIEGMITTLGGDVNTAHKANQKAAYLKSLIEDRNKQPKDDAPE